MFAQVLLWVIPLLFRGRKDQCFQIISLQQQLDVYQRQQGGKRLQLTDEDRWFWMMLRRRWPRWRDALVIVKPVYCQTFARRTSARGIRTIHIPEGRPQCNSCVERLIRTFRQECLRHLIILDEQHLTWVLQEYLAYYHRARPHQGLGQETPLPRPRPVSRSGAIRCRPVLGGLHHDYYRAAA